MAWWFSEHRDSFVCALYIMITSNRLHVHTLKAVMLGEVHVHCVEGDVLQCLVVSGDCSSP
jgi:hypothetical protein